ncbi:hypothetical protein ACFE04_003644 [Oxalis oulophora]
MQDTLLPYVSNINFPSFSHNDSNFPTLSRPNSLHFPIFSLKTITPPSHKTISDFPNTTISLPHHQPGPPQPQPQPKPSSAFKDKMLYLDSIGLDSFSIVTKHPPIVLSPLHVIKSTIDFLTSSLNLTSRELTRVISMCPEILASRQSTLLPILTFLLREVHVEGCDLKRVINRRPRLLVCDIKTQLRPTLYFLLSIGISEVNRHTYLLSCSVEDKLIPRIDYFVDVGLSRKDSISMFRRFPQLFNYSVDDNLKLKMDYFVLQIGGELKELKEFPQYFSFSLENRIKPRHQSANSWWNVTVTICVHVVWKTDIVGPLEEKSLKLKVGNSHLILLTLLVALGSVVS